MKAAKRASLFVMLGLLALGLLVMAPGAQAKGDIKVLNIAIGTDADTLNPQEQTHHPDPEHVRPSLRHPVLPGPQGKLHPHLAEGYKISKDGLTWTLSLRKGAKFSDGTKVDADAVKLTWDRILNKKMRVPLRFAVSMVKECVKIDDQTVALKLVYPFAPLAPTLSMTLCSPISPAAIKKYGDDVRRHPVGAGPYVLSKWVPGDRIEMTRNENYWGKKPTVKKIVWKIVPEAATREAMLRSGQVHICYKPLPSNVAALKADGNITVAMPLDTRTIFMGLNCQKGITKNKLVRQAFNYAVDKRAIVKKILFDTAEPMDGVVSPKVFGYVKMDKPYEYDPKKAKELLKKAKFDFNQVVKMRTPNGRYLFDKQVSEAVQAYLQAIGVKTELRTYDWPTYVAGLLKPLDKSELEVFLLGWGPLFLDADMGLSGQFTCAVNPPKGPGLRLLLQPGLRQADDQIPHGAGSGKAQGAHDQGLQDGV